MPPAPFASLRELAILCALLSAAAVPMACARGSTDSDIGLGLGGNSGAGGQTTGNRVTVTTTTTTTGELPSASSTTTTTTTTTTTGGFPSASSSNATTTTTSGFPSASSTTSGFPSASSTTTVGPSVTSTGVGGSSACDSGDCNSCSDCANNGPCLIDGFDCEFDPDCSTILCCAANCADDACINACVQSDPAGEALFNTYITCLACSCVVTCQIAPGTCP